MPHDTTKTNKYVLQPLQLFCNYMINSIVYSYTLYTFHLHDEINEIVCDTVSHHNQIVSISNIRVICVYACVCYMCLYLSSMYAFFFLPFYYLMLFIGSKSRCYRELCIIEHFSLIKFTCFLCIDGKHFSSSMCVCVCV